LELEAKIANAVRAVTLAFFIVVASLSIAPEQFRSKWPAALERRFGAGLRYGDLSRFHSMPQVEPNETEFLKFFFSIQTPANVGVDGFGYRSVDAVIFSPSFLATTI
jgi:hypothetical protein